MLRTLNRMKENLKYIGLWNIFIITLLIAMWNVFPIFYSYINKDLTEGLIEKKWGIVIFFIGLQISFWILSTLLNAYEQNIRQKSMTKAEIQTKITIREKLCSLPIGFFETPKNLEILSKANRNNAVYFSTYKNVIALFIMIPSIIVSVIPLIKMIPWSLIVLVVLGVFNALISVKCSDIEYLQSVRQLESERKRWYYKSLFYSNDTIKEIKAYSIQNWLIDKYEMISKRIFREAFHLHIRNGSILAFVDLLSMGVKIVLWVIVAFKAIEGTISIGNCVLFIGLWDTVISLIEEIRYSILGLYVDVKCLNDVNRLLDFAVEKTETSSISNLKSIKFEDVSFAYPANPENVVLHEINLNFVQGKCYLILGENGAGKSTLIKLILKHYKPTQGNILLNESHDISEIKELNVGYMAQEDVHFSLSVKDNILFGSEYEENRFIYAIEKAGIKTLIDELPERENTILGKLYEDGRELSGGQWQRISFARLLYNQSDIIILDEPTANLDPIAERNLYNEIQIFFHDKIVLLISHRLSSVSIADEIVFLENGIVKGNGTHSELFNTCEPYKNLFQIQKSIIEGAKE